MSSWILVGFITTEPQGNAPSVTFKTEFSKPSAICNTDFTSGFLEKEGGANCGILISDVDQQTSQKNIISWFIGWLSTSAVTGFQV